MSGETPIQWTDATWNPIRGCSRVSPGCQHCYAEAIAARFSGPGLAYEGLARRRSNGEPQWTGVVRVVESHMLDPISWRKPRRIFVNSMSDLFHESLPFETIATLFAVMSLAPQHTFQVLTKRPARMLEFFRWVEAEGARLRDMPQHDPWDGVNVVTHHAGAALDEFPDNRFERFERALNAVCDDFPPDWPLPNVWLGVSVENQEAADERIPQLLATPAAIRFLSCEPLLGPLNFRQCGGVGWCRCQGNDPYVHKHYHEPPNPCARCAECDAYVGIDWVIVGGESGRSARPCNVDWVRSILTQCRDANVPAFVKQLGAKPRSPDLTHWRCYADLLDNASGYALELRDSHGGDMAEWPEDLRVREFPAVRA